MARFRVGLAVRESELWVRIEGRRECRLGPDGAMGDGIESKSVIRDGSTRRLSDPICPTLDGAGPIMNDE
jgi:hypothetical protein